MWFTALKLVIAVFLLTCNSGSICDTAYASKALIVPHGEHDTLAKRAVLSLSRSLRKLGLSLDAAAFDRTIWADPFEALQIPFYPLQSAHALCKKAQGELIWLYEREVFRGFIVSTTDFIQSALCLRALPGTISILWVQERTRGPKPRPMSNVEGLVTFDYVCFRSKSLLWYNAPIISPLGHPPFNFRVASGEMLFDESVRALIDHVCPSALVPWKRELSSSNKTAHHRASDDFCPAHLVNLSSKLAVVLHLGSRHPKVLQLGRFRNPNISDAHIWITYFRASLATSIIHRAKTNNLKVHPILVRNLGLDIGPFFLALWHMQTCKCQYKYVLKYHYKSDRLHPFSVQAQLFLTGTRMLTNALGFLEKQHDASAVYPRLPRILDLRHSTDDKWFLGFNLPYIQEFQRVLPVPIADDGLLAGNCWLTRMDILSRWLKTPRLVEYFYRQLNDIEGVDWRWYNRNVLNASCNRRVAIAHFYNVGRRSGLPGHPYNPQFRSTPLERDGLVEHAWERFLSFMLSDFGPWFAMEL